MKTKQLITSIILLAILISGCGSSTGSRYSDDGTEEESVFETTEDVSTEESAEVFDMTPYHARIEFDINVKKTDHDIWYGYDSTASQVLEEISSVIAGYRVEVFSSDNLDESNVMKSELSSRVNQQIYIIFDPPFYRVRVGDFETRNTAESQSFRLRQLGYQESRVVSDSVNVSGMK